MSDQILQLAHIDLGVVPTHLKFVGGLVPDEAGRIPRSETGKLLVLANMAAIIEQSPVRPNCVQIPYFPGLDENDVAEMVDGFRSLELKVHFILMVGGADPMNPADEETVIGMLVDGLTAAKNHGVQDVSSTSVEEWMQAGASRKEGDEFVAAVTQNVRVHTAAVQQAALEGSSVEAWHIEFLRGGEFQTFTDVGRIWQFVKSANDALGRSFFKVMIDAAHCGDSALTISENESLIEEIASANAL